ncbi:T-lymphocyte surface antigen Ly-9 isoform X8 [Labrus bergylta]|uniref:T-lymphocyte surface antigen Ly-9 isoform X8 n=1 Tax=Labrus bergylta TaxID=56723 RepID=UPI0033144942
MQQLHMLVFSLVLFWISHPVNALETVYGAEGDDIVLTPPLQSPSPPITSIQWKHGEDIIAEWYQGHGNETNCLKFKGRCKLSLLTGALTITGLTKTDSGIYNPEINNKYLDSTHLIVISHVPKPSISKSCNTEMTACNLTCEGNTIESEPVDCKWLLDDAEGPSGKVLTITKEMKEQSYRCIFVNPVGNKTSDIMTNPLLKVETVYGAEGDDIVLTPPLQSPSPPITSIQWKHGEDIIAEWYEVYGNETNCLKFKGRCKLNLLTGALTITGLTKTDSGICKPEINNKYLDSTHLIVISHVPKPSISKSCNTEMTACNLTCEGNTIESEPVDCKWLLDEAEGPSGKVLTITKEMKEQSYRCIFVNPVNNKTSDIMTNPLLKVETVYGAEGDDIVLTPPLQSPSPPITSIQWKHGEDIIAEWYQGHGNETNCLKFKGRCKLSLLTGALTITGLTKTDSGIYNPEINNKYLDSTHLIVISHVPKPSISKSCNTEMTACNLTCEGNTIESEPVDCKWLLDDAEGPSGKVLTITKEMKEQSYRCIFVNPVGNKTSDIMTNPLLKVETVYGAKGDDIVLTPPLQSPSPPITSIQWKHGEDIIAEWYEVYGNETNCLKFKGRCKLNRSTGALTITGLTKTDSGICKPEINNKYLDSTHLIVISRVPKPSVSKSCNTEMTACNLTCEGNTIESEPVDCKWLLDEAEGPSGKVLTITKEMKEQSYRCVFVNPVGYKTSDIMTNPLLKVENVHSARNRWLIAVGVLLVLLVPGLIAAYFIYKRKPARGSYGFVPTKEEDNNVIEVHVPPTTQDSDSLCNGSVIPEEQRASNEPSDSIPLQNVCNGAGKASEISSNNDLTTSTSPEAGKEADITSEMGPESPQDSITPETGKETEITSDVVEKSDENSTTPASPASSQETGDLATKPPDQEQTNQEPPAAEQEADDAGDLDEH